MAPPPGVSGVRSRPLSPQCAVHRVSEAFTGKKDSNCLLSGFSLWRKGTGVGVGSPSAGCYNVTMLQSTSGLKYFALVFSQVSVQSFKFFSHP